jgi:hypothetical protein
MVMQLHALGQWMVVNGTICTPVPATIGHPTPDETCQMEAWLQAAQAYAEIALQVKDGYGGVILNITNPHEAWTALEQSYSSQQSGIQAVISAKFTLSRWDGMTPITNHCDYMKELRTHLSGAGLAISDLQFYNHFVNSLPADYDMIVAVHDPSPHYSVDTLCECFRTIELWRELHTSRAGGTTDDSIALWAKYKGSMSIEKPNLGQGEGKGDQPRGRTWKQKGTCWRCGKALTLYA